MNNQNERNYCRRVKSGDEAVIDCDANGSLVFKSKDATISWLSVPSPWVVTLPEWGGRKATYICVPRPESRTEFQSFLTEDCNFINPGKGQTVIFS